MASKGQKFNSYSPELKKEILDKYHNGLGSALSLGKEYGISKKTINNWLAKERYGKNVLVDHRIQSSGRKKEQDIDYKERYEILKNFQAFLKAQRDKK